MGLDKLTKIQRVKMDGRKRSIIEIMALRALITRSYCTSVVLAFGEHIESVPSSLGGNIGTLGRRSYVELVHTLTFRQSLKTIPGEPVKTHGPQ